MTNLERIRKELSPARRKKIKARAAQLIAEEMTLQELRRARKLTQVSMAKALGIGQDGVSKLEKRADLNCGRPLKRWAAACLWWPNSLTAHLSSYPALPKANLLLSPRSESTLTPTHSWLTMSYPCIASCFVA